jgi:hypothetical protein
MRRAVPFRIAMGACMGLLLAALPVPAAGGPGAAPFATMMRAWALGDLDTAISAAADVLKAEPQNAEYLKRRWLHLTGYSERSHGDTSPGPRSSLARLSNDTARLRRSTPPGCAGRSRWRTSSPARSGGQRPNVRSKSVSRKTPAIGSRGTNSQECVRLKESIS